MFRLAFKNITAKPLRAVATILVIALAVAMIFCMLSFKDAVFEYIFGTQTAISGDSDIVISASSGSDRLTIVADLVGSDGSPRVSGVKSVVPSLALYAMLEGEYVQARGFEFDKNSPSLEALQSVDFAKKREGELKSDDVVISESTAKHFGIDVDDRISLSLDGKSVFVFVGGIAKQSGYFLADSPFLILGFSRQLSGLLIGGENELFNEIYLKTDEGADVEDVIARVKGMPRFEDMLVRRANDSGAAQEQTSSLTAPIVLAGGAVLALGVAIIALLFLMGEREKQTLISKLTVIGGTRGQITGILLLESGMLALAGALIGVGLSVGIFAALVKLTLSSSAFAISVAKLAGAAALGFFTAIFASLYPIFRSMRKSVRESQLGTLNGKNTFAYLTSAALVVAFAVSVALYFSGHMPAWLALALGVLIIVLAVVGGGTSLLVRGTGGAMKKTSAPDLKVAGNALKGKRHARSATLLAVGTLVAMILFMAWQLTSTIFTAYISDFEGLAFVSNIRADASENEFLEVEGVQDAVKLVWQQGNLSGKGLSRSVSVLGSSKALSLVDFKYVTPEDQLKTRLLSDEPYVFVDNAFCKLYGIDVGDSLWLTIADKKQELKVGGVLSHRLFNGAYVILSENTLDKLYGLHADTVIARVEDEKAIGALSNKFAHKNYYVIDALTAYRWEMESTQAVFDLVGTLAFLVTFFILVVAVAATLVGRSSEERGRVALLNAGMSKNMLLRSEIAEHAACAISAFVVALLLSLPLTGCLIGALELFGLAFEFMYNAGVVVAVGAGICLLYTAVPLAFNFKRNYSIKRARY